MRKLCLAAVYTALALGANGAAAEEAGDGPDIAALEALRSGDMRKLNFLSEPAAVPETPFTAADGSEITLADFSGRYVLVNFWATWCAPCRVEMPQLAQLQTDFGGDAFEVVTIATGRNSEVAMQEFFAEIGVDNLPLHRDPQQALARDLGVLGLPITLVLDPEGREIARLTGEADWSGESARAIVAALLGEAPVL